MLRYKNERAGESRYVLQLSVSSICRGKLTLHQIYATSEERKQRNRQAQAAFRERRTEYIKQLEATIKHQEETLQNLQQSHRSAADECLMLRYKNSLLERILLEKGQDRGSLTNGDVALIFSQELMYKRNSRPRRTVRTLHRAKQRHPCLSPRPCSEPS